MMAVDDLDFLSMDGVEVIEELLFASEEIKEEEVA
jgi:hypothetical protein